MENREHDPIQEGSKQVVIAQDAVVSTTETTRKVVDVVLQFILRHKRPLSSVCIVLIMLVVGVLLVGQQEQHVAVKQFTNVYTFVPEKISKSAPIQINLPEGIGEDAAREGISFSPEIDGVWKTETIDQVVVFEPNKPLRSGVYYAVNLDTGSVQLSGDFFVDEDPKIEAIFPVAGSESHEDSEITIVFNRPMVPLTTLSEQEKIELPITITPETPGTFKWISTRNLQFVPETTLVPSSEYTVEIHGGLFSLDGLPVAPVTHEFTTRPLRYEYVSSGQIGYRSPIVLAFNQAVDLEKTKEKIVVTNQEGKQIPTVVRYGEVTEYDQEAKKQITETDTTKVLVYQKEDRHGRNEFWDFDTTYSVSVSGAVPLTGTKPLTEGRNSVITVANMIERVSAQSERSEQVRPDFFDPEGTVTIAFYEAVDKDRSDITVKGLRAIRYGERCSEDEEGNTIWKGASCVKEPDRKQLILSFDPQSFTVDESFELELEEVVTEAGLTLNADPIVLPIRTYPAFQIQRTLPESQHTAAALNEMYVCSNTPLREPPEEEGMSSYIQTDGYIVFGRWQGSRYLDSASVYNHCQQGEFETNIRYGLLPETDYHLNISLIDEFGQTNGREVSFKTREPEEQYTRFHNLQQQYNVTTPERTKLTYAVENLEYVDMHICRTEPEMFLEHIVAGTDDFTPPTEIGCTQVVTKRISLPARYWVNNYFQIDLKEHFSDPRGHYVLTFSNPLYKESNEGRQRYDHTYVSVTNLAVGKKEVEYSDQSWSWSNNPNKEKTLHKEIVETANLYWVNQSKTLSPAVGAVVIQFTKTDDKPLVRKTMGYTDSEGIARAAVHSDLVGAVVRSGTDTAVVSDWSDTLLDATWTRDASRTYVYTDRPIYRPGQTVYIRGIDRIGFDGEYEIWNKEQAKVTIMNSRGEEVYQTAVEISDHGTFATEFALPSDAPLGIYNIDVFGMQFWFSVEEYVPAAFKVTAETNQEEYINGDTFELNLQAEYYFGVPVSEGTVSYSVTAQDYHFDRYTDEYFNFGESWYYCYYCGYGDDFLFRGKAEINERGQVTIKKALDLKEYFDDPDSEGSKLVTVSLTAKDSNGRSVSTQKSFIVHKGNFYIGAKTDQYYTGVHNPITFRIKTVDTKGEPVSLEDITRTVYKVNWETFKRQEVDGGFYYRSEKRLKQISEETVQTNGSGDWKGSLSFEEEGEYEIHVTKKDEKGNVVKTISNIYIFGSQAIPVPPNNNYELDLEVEKVDVEVGDTASLLIKSPYDRAKVLITAERGTIYDYWVVDVVGGLYLHQFPVKSEYAPNMYVSALLLSSDPEVKYGSVEYSIGTSEHELSIEVTPDKTQYLPGEKVTLQVDTKDHRGQPDSAEVSLAVADLSVLALRGNPKKNPVAFFYDGFPLSVSTVSNIKNILYEVDIPLGSKGGDGVSPDDLAKKKRGIFKDTAFWEAAVTTDANGQARVTFTLPDNLTTWQIESLGVTKDTKLGVDYTEFTTKKDLMAVPLKPRFVVPGDTFSLGAKVFNQTDRGAEVSVKLESGTLTFADKTEDSVFINAGEAKTIYFTVIAPTKVKAGEHQFTFTATTDSFVDSVEQTISITPNAIYETVATANVTKEDKTLEYLYVPREVLGGEGGLTINANATMAVFMTDALSYMVTYPYGCSEQLASSLSTIGTVTSALTLPNVSGEFDTIEYDGVTYTVDAVVQEGLTQIYEAQTYGGGFAYYKDLQPNLSLTMHVATALLNIQKAGYDVRADVLERAASYIENETRVLYTKTPLAQQETVILAEYILRQLNGGTETSITSIVKTIIADQAFLNEKISSLSLAYLAILTAEGFGSTVRDRVYTALQNRIDIDGRGSYLASVTTANRGYYETPIKNTALLLKVFVAHQDEHPAMGNVLRWLLASRDRQGVWGGTHNTFIVVDAMIDYLRWQKETESQFLLRGLLDGEEVFNHEFNAQNIFETFSHFIPIDTVERGKLLPVVFDRKNKTEQPSNLYYDMSLKYFLPVEALPPRDEGITITRGLYALTDTTDEKQLATVSVGDVIRGKLTITIPEYYEHLSIEDIIPAGFEIVNFNLDTEDQSLREERGDDIYGGIESSSVMADSRGWWSRVSDALFGEKQLAQAYRTRGLGGGYENTQRKLYPAHTEAHDDRVFLYVEELSPGVYEYEYFLRALVPGKFQHLPARAEELFFPEIFGRTAGDVITITPVQ
jgi:uncharacterized protein YfaS (alpha-2-macroglobulin family)